MSYYDHYEQEPERKSIRELHDQEQYEAELRDRHYEPPQFPPDRFTVVLRIIWAAAVILFVVLIREL